MQSEVKVWLFDILQSIEEIEGYFAGKPMLFESFRQDSKTKRAVERNLEIIGEAIGRILKKDFAIQITNARKVVDARNKITHGYDVVSDELIWGIIINHLPKLKEEVKGLVREIK